MDKTYEAIAPLRADLPLPPGSPQPHRGRRHFFRQREVPGEPNSETHIDVLEVRGDLARYRLTPVTGQHHQLRVHMHALGRPIVGDLFYPEVVHGPGHTDEDYSRPLQLLARSIAFIDPVTGAPRRFESQRRLQWP